MVRAMAGLVAISIQGSSKVYTESYQGVLPDPGRSIRSGKADQRHSKRSECEERTGFLKQLGTGHAVFPSQSVPWKPSRLVNQVTGPLRLFPRSVTVEFTKDGITVVPVSNIAAGETLQQR